MAAPTDTIKSPPTDTPTPESPTTARPLEMDDDDLQDTALGPDDNAAAKTTSTTTPKPSVGGEAPPPQPPRPISEIQDSHQMLKEAFPSIDMSVIKAVLRASQGQVEPAFNALLEMTDPDAAQEEAPPAPPPRPRAAAVGPTSTAQSQLEADEEYARRLAEHYDSVGAYENRTANTRNHGASRGGQQATGLRPDQLRDDREHSFLDDDLPVIKESLLKGFAETQTKVNSWVTALKKKIDEQFDEDDERNGQGSSSFIGRPTRDQSRRSADYDRYDNDPELLSDDFAGMKFNSDGTPVQGNRYNNQYGANPNLFKPPPPSKSPKPNDGRRVAFAEDVEDIDAYNASPRLGPNKEPSPPNSGKASKWQPLSAVEPSPIAENDPFSLGDSDDERDAKDKKEIKLEDSEDMLRKATADAMADSLVGDDKAKAGESADKAK
ncbi:hypothetical protein B0T18DRAFT_419166 [Schizothecium vesticola]|uniref:CUE domain-containing protein n=1 Tax=Schizothecium vesticola TaxID=314040 RepID=A0AA40EKF1_9PEZI|nr:hypothetical protein B0T18DRAFT_419166 [Schizothecium vesticola]